jgi:dTDP-4-dehydrorhamnose reductase
MKILITGGSGLLGQYLNIELSKSSKIKTIYNNHLGNCSEFQSAKVDLRNFNLLEKTINDFSPDVVIHAAAISSTILDNSLDSKDIYQTNVSVTEKLAELCDKCSAKLFYLSTDLVYAGYRGSMLLETAKLIPISIYAETKLMGELKIQQKFDNFIILRTALLYGFGLNHSTNHFQKMFNDLRQNKNVKLFTDQYRTPISLLDASRVISQLIKTDLKSEIINFGGIERLSRFELGEKLCEFAKLDKSLLVKIKLDDVPELPKVEDVSLNTDKLVSFGIKRDTVEESIKEIISQNYH